MLHSSADQAAQSGKRWCPRGRHARLSEIGALVIINRVSRERLLCPTEGFCARQSANPGQVAQLAERSPEKAGVGGSIPSLATISSKALEARAALKGERRGENRLVRSEREGEALEEKPAALKRLASAVRFRPWPPSFVLVALLQTAQHGARPLM